MFLLNLAIMKSKNLSRFSKLAIGCDIRAPNEFGSFTQDAFSSMKKSLPAVPQYVFNSIDAKLLL